MVYVVYNCDYTGMHCGIGFMMNGDQRNAIEVGNIMSKQHHQYQLDEYDEIERISEMVMTGVETESASSACIGVCRLGHNGKCIGCRRTYFELSNT
jgi:hypothetical protein